jgi:hypothetical protein
MLHDPLDYLARSLATAGSRRRLLGALAGAPLLGGLLTFLDGEETEGKKRRRKRKGKRRKQHRRGCKPKKRTVVCAGRCGPVTSKQTCGKTIDCGSCECDPPCGECFTCQGAVGVPGTCVPMPDGTTCSGDNVCCGGTCQACCDHSDCGTGAICVDGTCQACDVTCTGNADTCGNALRGAIDAATSDDTIVICPGTYGRENSGPVAWIWGKNLTLIGAGTGKDGTILHGGGGESFSWLVNVYDSVTELRNLTVTDTNGGSGISVSYPATLILTGVLVTRNHALYGGGIDNYDTVILNAGTTVTGNGAVYGGGVANNAPGSRLTLNPGSRVVENAASASAPGVFNWGTVVVHPDSKVEGCENFGSGTGCP